MARTDSGIESGGLAAVTGVALVLATVLPLAAGAPPAEDLCDPELERDSDSEMAYRARGDRCEGLYRLSVNSDDLVVKSWTTWYENFDPAADRPLELSWSTPSDVSGPVYVRATSLEPRTFFRMDTRRSTAETSWPWPTQLLARLRLGRGDLGVLSWAPLPAGEDGRVYLPLSVRQGGEAEPFEYRVALVPGQRLTEVSWAVLPVLDGGAVDRAAGSLEPLGFGYYPAGMPTVFTVPWPARRGLHVLVLHAQTRSGGEARRELWFYHPQTAARSVVAEVGGAW